MDSNKSLFLVIAIAILGGIVFSQFADISPAVAFVLGVVATFFVVKFSSAAPTVSKDSSQSTKTLYVGNLPYKANESHVKDLFAEYGEVFAVRLMKDKRTGKRRGFGFVVMASSDAKGAIEALNEKDYMQRTLKVRIANDPKHPESASIEQD
ncbi:RNA-binding protein [Vibrio variabilis]|jgi:RNA recognition motif-containing protein|uniref:RNA-binding protein n=1 Tax=Vibrio maritimus TaxID=990268 RepID=A0A090TEF3_9VIBR|nr:RNA-binding protein [Vibrio variabilis]GAL37149.1 RNA-binding protein [Vibrio maritimus]